MILGLDFLFACSTLRYQFGVLPPSFIGFILKALPNSSWTAFLVYDNLISAIH